MAGIAHRDGDFYLGFVAFIREKDRRIETLTGPFLSPRKIDDCHVVSPTVLQFTPEKRRNVFSSTPAKHPPMRDERLT